MKQIDKRVLLLALNSAATRLFWSTGVMEL
jgi:hypothetical protein